MRTALTLILPVVAAVLPACSSPASSPTSKTRDLGGFVIEGAGPDLSVQPAADMGKVDLASPTTADLSQPHDLASPGTTGCGNVTYAGFCTGTVVTWCDFGELQTYDCGDDFLDCTVVQGDADCR